MTTIAAAFSRMLIPAVGALDDDSLIGIAMFCRGRMADLLNSAVLRYRSATGFSVF
jgi:hypothetical protein